MLPLSACIYLFLLAARKPEKAFTRFAGAVASWSCSRSKEGRGLRRFVEVVSAEACPLAGKRTPEVSALSTNIPKTNTQSKPTTSSGPAQKILVESGVKRLARGLTVIT